MIVWFQCTVHVWLRLLKVLTHVQMVLRTTALSSPLMALTMVFGVTTTLFLWARKLTMVVPLVIKQVVKWQQ